MKFFRRVRDSIYNPSFYKSLPQLKLESALSYFFIFIFFLSLIQTLLLAFPTLNFVTGLTNKDLPKLISSFPQNLQINIKNGVVSTNAAEPYFFPLPAGQSPPGGAPQSLTDFKNLFVIDTVTPYSPEEFKNYNTFALLTKNTLYYKPDKSQLVKSTSLSNVKNLTIDREHLTALLNKFSPLFKFIYPVAIFLILVLLFLFYILRLVYLFFLAAVILLVSRMIQPTLSYGQSYKVGIHAMTLGLLIETLLTIVSPLLHLRGFPYMVTILSVIVFVVNFKTQKEVS